MLNILNMVWFKLLELSKEMTQVFIKIVELYMVNLKEYKLMVKLMVLIVAFI